MPEPNLKLTVSRQLWDDMAEATYPEFADSYLSGAKQTASTLVPHTETAWLRLASKGPALRVIQMHKLKLIKPLPFGHPARKGT